MELQNREAIVLELSDFTDEEVEAQRGSLSRIHTIRGSRKI